MNADDLRAVAAEIRKKANAAVPSPWTIDDDNMLALASVRMPYAPEYPKRTELFSLGTPDDATAHHIAAWHPAVAIAVADWLDLLGSQEECDWSPGMWARGVAFVKAWRGES